MNKPNFPAAVREIRARGHIRREDLIATLVDAYALTPAAAADLVDAHQHTLTVDDMHDVRRTVLDVASVTLADLETAAATLRGVLSEDAPSFEENRAKITAARVLEANARARLAVIRDALSVVAPKAVRHAETAIDDDDIVSAFSRAAAH